MATVENDAMSAYDEMREEDDAKRAAVILEYGPFEWNFIDERDPGAWAEGGTIFCCLGGRHVGRVVACGFDEGAGAFSEYAWDAGPAARGTAANAGEAQEAVEREVIELVLTGKSPAL